MKKLKNEYIAIGNDDVKVDITFTDNFKVLDITAKEKFGEYNKGDEIKLSATETKELETTLKEEYGNELKSLSPKEMTPKEKQLRLKEIDEQLKALREERFELMGTRSLDQIIKDSNSKDKGLER